MAAEGVSVARRGACAVMVTGSHIPEDRNGLKFYRPDGEITKADEAAILEALAGADLGGASSGGTRSGDARPEGADAAAPGPDGTDPDARDRYRRRYAEAFPPDALAGLRVAVYQQSSVARDLLADLLAGFGARVTALGRADRFVPIDTEAHRPEDVAFIRQTMAGGAYDALVTTDGDADRPLVADGAGKIVRGDVLGLITARYLGVDAVAVPVTAGSAIERVGGFGRVVRTRVGSPFVIAGMEAARRDGAGTVAGFEANGGFLLGSAVAVPGGGSLPALPTRDAALPILAALAAARAFGPGVSAGEASAGEASAGGAPAGGLAGLVASLGAGETASDRLPDTPAAASGAFLARLGEAGYRRDFLAGLLAAAGETADVAGAVDGQDGVRVDLGGGRVIHFRASGNAPELRCYAEAVTAAQAQDLVRRGLAAAAAAMLAPQRG